MARIYAIMFFNAENTYPKGRFAGGRSRVKGGGAVDEVAVKEITRGVRLTAVRAERFKTGCLSMTLLAPHTKRTAALNAVLPYVLRRGTSRLTDMESIARALDNMYGARIEPALRKKGEVTALGFCADFPDGAFLPGRADILGQTAQLMGEMLLSPATRSGRLRGEFVESERRNLMDDIAAEINDKRAYASQRLTEAMFRGERYGVGKLGTLADAGRIGVTGLTRHYKELLSSAPLEVFYCGAEDPERVAALVREVLAPLPRSGEILMPATEGADRVQTAPPRFLTERMDVTQGRLVMGWRLGRIMERADTAALMVFNAAFGGAVTSKLFMNVRERLGLCYQIGSVADRYKGALFVSAGIDPEMDGTVTAEVERQLEALARGELEDWELEGARRAVMSSVASALDDQMGLEGMYLDARLDGSPRPEELAARALAVTREDIAAYAASAKLGCVYFLTAEDEDAENP